MGRTWRDMTGLRVSPCPCVSSGMCAWCAGCVMEGTFSTPRIFESIFSRPRAMSAETHIRLAEPFRPCAKSVRHFNVVTTIHGATTEDFDEDPWMTVVPCMDAHLDDWGEGNWDNMETRCPWVSQYKFANMLEFGDLIPLPDAVLGHKQSLTVLHEKCVRFEGERHRRCQGGVLDMCLFEGFGAGTANTPFYNDLRPQGGFVLGREFFDLLEYKGIALDVPCEVGPNLELSMPLQPCGGCESSGAAGEGGDLGSGEATHMQREDARGQFDDNEDEATPCPPFSPSRERDRLLSHDGAKWTVKKKKVKNVKPGVAYIHNDKLGRTKVVHNVPVDPPNKKGKKEKEECDWFVQVPDPDAHCWKAMESLTDNEKCRVLKKVLACEVVWVQAGSPSLAKLGKLSVQDMVQLVKCDRVLVRLWNYYQFKHEKRPDADWIQRYPFLKLRSAMFKKFEGQGLDVELWDNSRKHVSDSALFKDCLPYMGCDQDNSIEVTEKLAGHKKLSVDWRNKVLFVLNGSRLKSREVALAEGVVHIKWKDTGDVTSIAPFANDPLEVDIRGGELKKAVAATKSHTFVLDLCEPSLYFVESEEQLKLASYASLISTDDEEAIGVEFVANAKEEESDTESIDLQYDPPPADHGRGSSSAGPSPSAAALVSPLAKPAPGTTPMKLLERLRALAAAPPALRPGSIVPPDHPSWKDDNIHFLLEPQPIRNGEWVMAVAIPGAGWVSFPRDSKFNFLHLARISVLQKVKVENDTLAPGDLSVISTVGRLFDELQDKCWLELTKDYYELDTSPSKGVLDWKVPPPSGPDGGSGGGSPGSGGDGGGDAGGGKGIPPMGERGSHGRNTTPGGSAGVEGFAVDRTPSTGTRPEHTTHSADPQTSSVGSARDTLAALVALGSRSAGKRSCSGSGDPSTDREIRSIVARDGDVGTVSPERERQPQGLQREAASAGSGDTETTKCAEIRTSSGGVCRPGIVVPLRGAACTGTEGRSSRFGTDTAEGDEFRGREVGEEMEKQKGAQEGEEEGEEEVEGEEAGETELIDLFEGREGAGSGEDEVERSEDDAGSGESSDEFGQLYGEHHEDDVDDDATAIEMETQVVSSLSAEPEDYVVRPLTSAVDLQHRFDEASVAISPSEKSRRISIDEVIDGILGDHNVSTRPSATANVASSMAAALASSPPKSLVLQATLATEGEGECGGGQHVTSPKKSRFGGQALDVLALLAPNSPSKERIEK
ncbi:hypothetical protein CBR_g746 [Chara braunii]|uniref:Uncharacterized protein n=1 Tax=Chara braunii TaxID=69332 RepID=A0A388KC86_CHABU|nr:hypothetical protein CBR_g746 [Chara braunii]|eukprot:GBG67616.1 hypothetical protein CBR_g746 [Chara braunii]